eukprot:TRINITY_DN1060_c0_g2_i2.p1 TRINITY_DN1060_c0_g2~~TRINITY_DN1060_c0_g2_i2.p1  ORF type:complete len:1001 (+),score=229.81 TRINITY_DN1060_c0_g2_i2:61-3063(+)
MERCYALLTAALVLSAICCQAEQVHDLSQHGEELPLVQGLSVPGKISLIELQTTVMDAIAGQSALSADEQSKAKEQFMSMMFNFQSQGIRTDSLVASRLAESAFDKQGGSGLDLIFRKLAELEKKITDEQTVETNAHNANQESCKTEIDKLDSALSDASNSKDRLRRDSDTSTEKIAANRLAWRGSRNTEDATHELLVSLQKDRAERIEAVTARVDERNRAIDVMVAALFMVCENFNRFKDGPICTRIKSQPDVREPARYTTAAADLAEQETKALHAKGGEWDVEWQKQVLLDQNYTDEGIKHPEGGPIHDTQAAASSQADLDEMKKDIDTTKEASPNLMEDDEVPRLPGHETNLAKVIGEDEDDDGKWKLSPEELKAQKALEAMGTKQMPDKYKMPLVELALAIKQGEEKKTKNIVEILMDVIHITREEQANDKQKHTDGLDSDYTQSWAYKKIMNDEAAAQLAGRTEMEHERLALLRHASEAEELRVNMLKDSDAKTREEDLCNKAAEDYGVAEGMRVEDLENLVKLKSLLRMLYFKKKPLACPRNPDTKAVCSGMDRGWCVFKDKHPKNEQRCSCNRGFYGNSCQYQMCPGLAKNLYTHDALTGVCSNIQGKETRGSCDKMTGLCTCYDDPASTRRFYHGPKRACEWARAPPSKNGAVDSACSNRGRTFSNRADPENPITYSNGYDKVRGDCHCQIEYWGPGCEFKKCAGGSAGGADSVLYPSTSSNACAGRGACSDEDGGCTCPWPYHGPKCEFESCPGDCRASGQNACKSDTGKCMCQAPTWGHECEYLSCPADCNGSGGECNRNDGKCICKMGYSGTTCQKTQRCKSKKSLYENSMNWWTVWDKPGWITCPHGQLLYQLKRSLCSGLSCIDSGACAAGCEGDAHVFQLRHCYHDLRWYNSFDGKGWSKCLPDYYVAGLYRSCDSLYCLNLAKCCSLVGTRWTECKEANWEPIFNGPGTGKVPNDSAFITGFYRDEGHTITDIDKASYCGFVRGY